MNRGEGKTQGHVNATNLGLRSLSQGTFFENKSASDAINCRSSFAEGDGTDAVDTRALPESTEEDVEVSRRERRK